MKIADAAGLMSKTYLQRIVDSYLKDNALRADEDACREQIEREAAVISAPENVRERLTRAPLSFNDEVLFEFVISALVDQDDCISNEADICASVSARQQELVSSAKDGAVFKLKDATTVATYQTVLEVALEDASISKDEKRLLEKLRKHLRLTVRDHQLIQARLGMFPKERNELHSVQEIKSTLNELQKRGIVFYCNKHPEGAQYVIPSEIVATAKLVMGIELSERAFRLLLENLSGTQLRTILDSHELPKSGTKPERIDNIVRADLSPQNCLDTLGNDELYAVCQSLPGVKVSGSKGERVERIVSYFDSLRKPTVDENVDPALRFYDFYDELARRDRKNLLSNNIIQKDIDMERAFEVATRYLFESKFNIPVTPLPGTEHADGCVEMRGGERLLWDCKSKETTYQFPNDHVKQFKRYIRDSQARVNMFLVVAPEVGDSAYAQSLRLKAECGTDTDVAVVAAEDLKWLAESWASENSQDRRPLNLEILNMTGVLDRKTLKQRLQILG